VINSCRTKSELRSIMSQMWLAAGGDGARVGQREHWEEYGKLVYENREGLLLSAAAEADLGIFENLGMGKDELVPERKARL
jgi:hypothetical protein